MVSNESSRDYKYVRAWIKHNMPLVSPDEKYILCKDRVWSLGRGGEGTIFEGAISNRLKKFDLTQLRDLVRVSVCAFSTCAPSLKSPVVDLCSEEVDGKASDPSIHYFSPSRIKKTADVLIAVTPVLLLVTPILAMYELSPKKTKRATYGAIGLLMGFSLLSRVPWRLSIRRGDMERSLRAPHNVMYSSSSAQQRSRNLISLEQRVQRIGWTFKGSERRK
ncbi:uncharacterized protein M421DRAFT_345412 [Didymella exigua CBS 183.55]|uniref:DUF6594 domain-containing protein n=1 Tax=Didymella exigua CBS 183.55 TaxID=1150837 RepID=A0A6A5S1F7_9PLEO|nr:uncharacterized protein M421DRAFT_345412 [Didymella exigua CBS 183.55]KAF1931347.1 hypothetical protein M421DRAFT_345412 [Didymella exigua CBS 183.55]